MCTFESSEHSAMRKHQVSGEKDTSDQLFAKIFMPLLLKFNYLLLLRQLRTAKY